MRSQLSFTGIVIGGGYTDDTSTNNIEYFLPANPQVSSQCVLPPLTEDGNLPTFSIVQDSLLVCQSTKCFTLQDNTWVSLANLAHQRAPDGEYFHAVFGGNILRLGGSGVNPITTEVIDTTTGTSSSVSIDWVNNYSLIHCVTQVSDSVVIHLSEGDGGDVFIFTDMSGGGNVQLPSTTFTFGARICGHYDHADGSKVNKKPILIFVYLYL